jgi:hypothetical protein
VKYYPLATEEFNSLGPVFRRRELLGLAGCWKCNIVPLGDLARRQVPSDDLVRPLTAAGRTPSGGLANRLSSPREELAAGALEAPPDARGEGVPGATGQEIYREALIGPA